MATIVLFEFNYGPLSYQSYAKVSVVEIMHFHCKNVKNIRDN